LSKDLAADQACHGEQVKDPGQRTEKQFVALFESVGLEMTGIWKHPEGFDSVMEVTLPKS
jgi:hypothetical protein